MKKPVIILGAIALIAICCGQEKQTESDNNMVMEQNKKETHNVFKDYIPVKKLNIEEFRRNQEKYQGDVFILDDTTKMQQFEVEECFVEYIMPNGSLFKEYNTYYKNSGALYRTGLVYKDGFIKGVLKTYNESGELIKEEDYDAPFIFTFEDILKYLKDNEIDIHSERVTIGRYIDKDNNPIWTVKCRVSNYFTRKTMNGRTGEVLNTQKVQIEK